MIYTDQSLSQVRQTQPIIYEKSVTTEGGTGNANNKENCYSFLQQKSMKELGMASRHITEPDQLDNPIDTYTRLM